MSQINCSEQQILSFGLVHLKVYNFLCVFNSVLIMILSKIPELLMYDFSLFLLVRIENRNFKDFNKSSRVITSVPVDKLFCSFS